MFSPLPHPAFKQKTKSSIVCLARGKATNCATNRLTEDLFNWYIFFCYLSSFIACQLKVIKLFPATFCISVNRTYSITNDFSFHLFIYLFLGSSVITYARQDLSL